MYLLIIKPCARYTLYDLFFTWRSADKAIEKCVEDGVKWELLKFRWSFTAKRWTSLVWDDEKFGRVNYN